jgi:HK97 family phage major capsid protein
MTIPQLETDLRAKQAQIKDLMERTMRACADHVVAAATATTPEVRGREMTAEEKAAITSLLDEGKAIRAKIDRLRGDESMLEAINGLTGGLALAPPLTGGRADRRSLGQQFVTDPAYRAVIAAGRHRIGGSWTSPSVEGAGFFDLRATTLGEGAGAGGAALVPPDLQPGIVALGHPRVVVADLIAPGTTDSNIVSYMKETTFTNAAAPVAEGANKPESTLVFALATAPVRKLAHWIPVTEELLEDSAQTQSVVDARLRLGLALAEEDQLLNGTGVAPALLGFNALPGLAADVVRTDPQTNADAIFVQMTAIATNALIMPDGTVMNPANWATIQLSKTSQGAYLGSGPFAAPQVPMLWGVPVAVTPAQVLGTALTGGFRSAAQLFRRGGIRIEASNSHASFFIQNLVAIRGEERLALAVYREAAFGQITTLT